MASKPTKLGLRKNNGLKFHFVVFIFLILKESFSFGLQALASR
jgi:hypothetical protein